MPILILSIVTSLAGQILLKKGTLDDAFGFDASQPVRSAIQFLLNPYFIGWIASAGVSAVLWIMVVARFDLSFAHPFSQAAIYVLLLIVSNWMFGETISGTRWAGVLLISVGVFLTYRSN